MKQKLLYLLLLTVALVTGSSGAWADLTPDTRSWDFEGSTPTNPFTQTGRGTMSIVAGTGANTTNVVNTTSANNAGNGAPGDLMYFDFTNDNTAATETVEISFDCFLPQISGQMALTIGDATTRKPEAFTAKGAWSKLVTGAIFNFSTERGKLNGKSNENYLSVSGANYGSTTTLKAADFLDIWVTVNVTVDIKNKKVSYTMKKKSDNTQLVSVSNADFLDANATKCTQIDLQTGVTNVSGKIDNLSITQYYDASKVKANYTIKYVDGYGTEIKDSRTVEQIVGEAATILDSDKESFKNNDNTKKYIYASDDAAGKTVASNGSTVVTITFSEAEEYTATLNLKAGTVDLTTVTETAFEGDNLTLYYKKAYLKDGDWYSIAQNSAEPYYGKVFNNMTASSSIDITNYAKNDNIYDFYEIEELSPSRDWAATGAVTGRYSNGIAKRFYKNSYVAFGSPIPGIYSVTLWARNQSSSQTATLPVFIKDSEENLIDTEKSFEDWAKGGFGEKTVTDITIPATGYSFVLNNNTDWNSNLEMDYVYITRTGDAPLTEGIFLAKGLDEESDVENLTISEDISATTTDAHYLNSGLGVLQFSKDGTLTLKSEKEGFGFTKITFNASSLNCSASTGSISNGVWTGNASEVTFTFNGVSNINSILIGNSTLPVLETATTIAEFKAGAIDGNEMKLVLDNAEILRVNGRQTIFQDATGGIATYINIEGAQVGKTLSGSLSGVYVPSSGIMLMDGTQTNFYTAKVSNTTSEATAYTMTVEEAIDEANAYRIATLKGVSISEEDGKFYATDKTGESILIQVTPALADYIKAGDVLASLTGFIGYGDGNGNSIQPRTADDIVSGLIWQGNDLENGSPLNADLTSGDILEKMAELKAGDEIHIELMSLNNVELEGQGTPLTISTAAGKTIYTIYLKEENLQEGTVSFPITQDVVREINKHGMTIEADANVTIVYVEPGKYDAEEEDIWLSDETAIINGLEIGDAHFKDVRESDVVELEAADDLDMTIENYSETEEYISGDELSDEQAALLQDGKLIVEAPATGLTRISFYKNAVRDDKAEVTENEDGTYDSYKQGEKGLVNGMIMTFGGNDPEGAEYEFAEVYPEVNKFGSATEGIDQLPVDNDGKAFDKKQNNLPTKGTYYVFEPTKNGTLEITAGIEAGKTIVFAEEGGEAMVDQADDDYEGMNAVEVEATKTYYLFSPDSNLKFFGFTFTPADKDAKNVAKDIATFKLLNGDDIEGDTLLLKDAVVTYIKGDNVFVEDATGAIDFYRTRIQYYVGQKLNGYIVGNSGFVSEEYPMPALLRTDATKYGQFKVTENVTPEATVIAMSETDDLMNVDRFVKLENVKVSTDNKGFKILTDGETSILIEDHFNVFYTLEENLVSIEGIIGMDKELTNRFWPTSQEGIVLPEQEASATLVHTAAVQGGSNEAGSSLDAVSHYYNNWGTTAWVAQAYAGFNLVIPENNTVTSAKLKFRSYCGGNRDGRAIDVYYKDGTDFNYSDLTLIAAAQAGTKVTSLTENRAESDKEVDVTEAVNAILAGGSDNIVFVFAGGAAGGQIYGKGSADYAPTLELTTVDASKTTSYTVNFVDANGKALKEAAIYDAQAVGATATASEADMAAFKNADGSKKYIYESGNDEITLVKNAESNVINLVFREAAMWSYTVNALEGEDNVLQTIKSGKDFEGETINVPTPRRLVIDGVVYASATTGGQESSVNVTLDADNKVASMTYTETEEANVVFFAEAEDIETMTVNTGAYVQVRCSNKAGGYAAEDAAIVTLKAGTYTITAASYASASTTFVFKAGDKEVLSHTGSGGWSEGKSDAFTLTADAVLTVKGGTKDYALDYLYIQSADGSTTGISNVNAERNNGAVYNLSGQKVNGSLKKGLYIINGKKVIVK